MRSEMSLIYNSKDVLVLNLLLVLRSEDLQSVCLENASSTASYARIVSKW